MNFTPTRTQVKYNNDKPWFSAELRQLCQAQDEAYRSGYMNLYRHAKYKLKTGIRAAKERHTEKLKDEL